MKIKYCNVLVTKPFNNTFTYKAKIDQSVSVGDLVIVPFGRKNDQVGIIYEIADSLKSEISKLKIKEIKEIYKNLKFKKDIIEFIDWIANYTLAPKGLVLKLFITNNKLVENEIKIIKDYNYNIKKINLNSEQKNASSFLKKFLVKKFNSIVLEGVTGSGKTEVYFEAVKNILKQNKQVLIMLPEISLTPQLEQRFEERFGFQACIWHSKISEKKRKEVWQKTHDTNSFVVIGARSSLFLPFKNLGLIVVDEEHDMSFKQEENIRYQARDLAIVKAKIEKIPIILSSATPSLETYNNIKKGKFKHFFLSSQYSGLDLPDIELINLKKEKLDKDKWISKKIIIEIEECIKNKSQALLFLNRRGYSPLTLCNSCGYRYQCDNCTTWLVLHRNKKRLLCHQCGSIYPIQSSCPKCECTDCLKLIGPGIERIAEEIKTYFPNNNISLMSSDNANTPKKIKKIVEDFENKKIDILVATQIMAKGYHFPDLSMVGVIDCDSGLMGGDLRAIEKTYNLLQQVSGRAGRTKKTGKVFIQTYYPDQPVIQSFKSRDRNGFVEQSLSEREQFKMPPFGFINSIIISSSSKIHAEAYSRKIIKEDLVPKGIEIFGPVEAPLFLLRGKYRFRILIKGDNRQKLNKFTSNLVKKTPEPSNVRLIIDVDPYNFV